ncbi:MAG: carboxypeptidase regulatory-like domain-containing protein [Gemmatimonadota bacterium]|nr:carboxypeptidase regulatory-like domain-containing protein [Gemmatimonadota bacterium]
MSSLTSLARQLGGLRTRALCTLLAAVAMLGLACTEGRLPTGPASAPQLVRLVLNAQVSSAGRTMKVLARYGMRTDAEVLVSFDSATVALTGTETQLPVRIDLAPCLAASNRELPDEFPVDQLSSVCVLRLELTLLDANGAVIERVMLLPIIARPGQETQAPEVSLGIVVQSVTVSPRSTTLNAIGYAVQLGAVAADAQGRTIAQPSLVYRALTPAIATVDSATGRVTARATGVARVSVTSRDVADTATITVQQVPKAITLTAPSTTIKVGDSVTVAAIVTDSGGTAIAGAPVSLRSSDTLVAVVYVQPLRVVARRAGTAVVTATSGSLSTTLSFTVPAPVALATVYGVVRDIQTLAAIPSASLTLTNIQTGIALAQTSSTSGAFSFSSVSAGTYVLAATTSGYQATSADNLKTVSVAGGDVVRVDFSLPPTALTNPIGGISGRVLTNGTAVAGATISLSGGTQTNGVFKSTTSAADGTYTLEGISLQSSLGNPITSFTVFASKTGFGTTSKTGITVQQNKIVTNVDFSLSTATGAVTTYFSDGFEGALAWTVTGFWNRTTGSGIKNTAYPAFVGLAPGDASAGALPAASEGSFYLWYGQASTGNFIGTQLSGDTQGSGGTSTTSNSGTATSPSFTISANAPVVSLDFDTWFEIESVNPNATGYDLMIVRVIDVSTNTTIELTRLNPFVDPTVSPRDVIPFSSGGFDRAPQYRPVSLDLSAYKGKQIKLEFFFDTVDGNYNGFRGWIVDNVRVTDQTALGLSSPLANRAAAPLTTSPAAAAAGSGRGRCTTTCAARRRH